MPTTSPDHFHKRLRFVLWGAAALVALAALAALAFRDNEPPKVAYRGEADVRSDFELVDHTGRAVTEADYADRWQLVFFGFTNCPDICPTTLAYMGSVLDLLGPEADRVAPIFITVDPARDTPEVMAEYVKNFHPALIGLSGTPAQTAAAAQSFKVYHEPMPHDHAPDGYTMAHAGYIYLMTPDGQFEAVYQQQDQLPEALAAEIEKRLDRAVQS